jgi:hypothetical protein
MRTGVRVSPSWLGGVLRSRIRCSRLIIGALEKSLANGAGHTFFKILDCGRRLGVMFGPRRQLAIVHGAQFPAHRLGRDDDAVFLEHPLAEVDKPPAHDAMNGRDRAILHHASQRRAVLRRQPRRLPRRLAGDEPRGTMSVELENPVPDDLKRHAADLRRFPPRRPVVNRRQRQKSTGLAPSLDFLASRRSSAASKSSRSGIGIANSMVRAIETNHSRFGNPSRVWINGSWY